MQVEFLENSAELLNKCVTLVPDDETFGALGATHKMLQALPLTICLTLTLTAATANTSTAGAVHRFPCYLSL